MREGTENRGVAHKICILLKEKQIKKIKKPKLECVIPLKFCSLARKNIKVPTFNNARECTSMILKQRFTLDPYMLCSGFTEQLIPCDPQGAQFSMALFFRWMRGLGKPSQVMISLIGQEWLPIKLITATTHHAIAAQQGTSSVWHAAHDYSCWRGGSACCQGLFWGQPANRGAFLITVRDLETVLTLWARKPLDQETNVPDLWQSVDQNDWRDVCVIYVLLLETLKAHM